MSISTGWSSMRTIARNATHPVASPSAAPPPASSMKREEKLPRSNPADPGALNAIPRSPEKRTIPTPSLKRDSPLISMASLSLTPKLRRMLNTVIGSVGLISAPKTSAHSSGRNTPKSKAASLKARPIASVDMTTPMVAIAPTVHLRWRSFERSTFSAPANSRKPSIPLKTVEGRLISLTELFRS